MGQKAFRVFAGFLLLCGALAAQGCSSGSSSPPAQGPDLKPPGDNGGMFRRRNEGYSLLYWLMNNESQVSGIFILKHADEPVGSLVKEIGQACKDAKAHLDTFPNSTNRIEFDVADLPRIEQSARDLESKRQTKELLTTSGKDFELRLLLTQIQALGYAINLCKSLALVEDDKAHIDFLNSLADRFNDFLTRGENLVEVKP